MAIQYNSNLDRTFHALGDLTRRRILSTLSEHGHCSAGELVKMFHSSQPTVSKHLRVMENAGLVARQVKGRKHYFCLRTEALKEADDWLQRHLKFWNNSMDRLGEFLDTADSLNGNDQ